MLDNASLGGKYPDHTPFSLDELTQHIGLYLFQGLSPSPQVEQKFHPQSEDPVNGSDFICYAFGGVPSKSKRRFRHFKSFFTSVNPNLQVPSRKEFPNWKVKWLILTTPLPGRQRQNRVNLFNMQHLFC